jgi:hypothetical protein
MAEIYYNFWYRNRSFVIVNEASVAMEFLLSSTLDHNDSTELNFSLENTSLKRFSSVTVDAKSRQDQLPFLQVTIKMLSCEGNCDFKLSGCDLEIFLAM